MVAVATNSAGTQALSLEKLQAEFHSVNQEIERLEVSLESSRTRRDNLVAERGPLVLPARTGKNADAQKRLHAIDAELMPLQRDIADDETALAELKAQAASIRNAEHLAEWEERRAKVRELLVSRMNSQTAQKIQNAARNLAAALDAARKEDNQLADEVSRFTRREGYADDLRSQFRLRKEVVAGALRENLELPRSHFYGCQVPAGENLAKMDRECVARILEALDDLEMVF